VVITAKVRDFIVQMMLIDTRSSRDVLFLSLFRQMEIDIKKPKVSSGLLEGFTSHESQILGSVDLLMVMGEEPKVLFMMVKFLMVDLPPTYNGIIG